MAQLHFFTDLDLLNSQNPLDGFGPLNGTSDTFFRLTSLHTASADPNAYAVVGGQVLVQSSSASASLVNIILRPSEQTLARFSSVKYYIYRGIKKSSLIQLVNGAEQLLPADPNDPDSLISLIHRSQQEYNQSYDKEQGNAEGTTTDQPSINALGIHYSPGYPAARSDSSYLDDLFLDRESPYELLHVPAGTKLGKFAATGFGFEIMVEGGGFDPQLGSVRGSEQMLSVPAMPSSPLSSVLGNRRQREVIFNYIDPCAWYGMHVTAAGVLAGSSAGGFVEKAGEAIHTDILKPKFVNSDRIYLDIRNEHSQGLTYNSNYGDDIKLGFGSQQGLATVPYASDDWPIRIIRNSDVVAVDPSVSGDRVGIHLALPKGDNGRPVLYLSYSHRAEGYPMLPQNRQAFMAPSVGSTWTDAMTIATPSLSGGGTEIIPYYHKLNYFRRFDANAQLAPSVVPTRHYLDNLFAADMLPRTIGSEAGIRFVSGIREAFVDAESELGFAGVYSTGVAVYTDANGDNQRVLFYGLIKELFSGYSGGLIPPSSLPSGAIDMGSFLEYLTKTSAMYINVYCRDLNLLGGVRNYLALSPKRDFWGLKSRDTVIALGLTHLELTSLLADASSLDESIHPKFIRGHDVEHTADSNGNGFARISVKLHGLGAGAMYNDLPTGSSLPMYTEDGLLLSTHEFTTAEGLKVVDPADDIIWMNDERSNGTVVYRLGAWQEKTHWPLYNTDGTYLIVDGIPALVPFGTRVVLLGRKNLDFSTRTRKTCFRIAVWHGGEIRDCFIEENALRNAKIPRIINDASYRYPSVALEAFMNDAAFTIDSAEQFHFGDVRDPVLAGDDPDLHPITRLLNRVKRRVLGIGQAPQEDSLMKRFMEGQLLPLYQERLQVDIRYRNIVGAIKQARNFPVVFEIDEDRERRIDKPATIEYFNSINGYRGIQNKVIALEFSQPGTGGPIAGSITLEYNGQGAVLQLGQNLDELGGRLRNTIGELYTLGDYDALTISGGMTETKEGNEPVIHKWAKIRFAATTEFAPDLLSITSTDIDSPVPTTVRIASKYQVIPLSMVWRDYLKDINDDYDVPLEDSSRLRMLSESIPNFQTGEPTVYATHKFEVLRNELGLVLEMCDSFSDPAVEATPEVQWLRQVAQPIPGQPGKYYVYDAIEIVLMGSAVWADEVGSDDVFLQGSNSLFVLIDQSLGYINSNPVLSVLIHEGTQTGAYISLRDTHQLNKPNFEEIWTEVQSRGVEYLDDPDPYPEPNPRFGNPRLALRQTFFQFNPALALVYLDYYCDLLEVN